MWPGSVNRASTFPGQATGWWNTQKVWYQNHVNHQTTGAGSCRLGHTREGPSPPRFLQAYGQMGTHLGAPLFDFSLLCPTCGLTGKAPVEQNVPHVPESPWGLWSGSTWGGRFFFPGASISLSLRGMYCRDTPQNWSHWTPHCSYCLQKHWYLKKVTEVSENSGNHSRLNIT